MTAAATETHEARVEAGIHLYAGKTVGAEAVIPVRWCICQTLYERMKARGAKKPHLLLVVANGDTELSRKLLPLDRAMEYVTFYRPGEHQLFAMVVWDEDGNVGRLRKNILGTNEWGKYFLELLAYDYDTRKVTFNRSFGGLTFREGPVEPLLTVSVSPEFFAKEPPEWLCRWVNWWYETKPRDQCQFRRRCILAFSIQPLVAPIWFIGLFLVRLWIASISFFFLGLRGIDFKPVICLRTCSTEDIWAENREYRRSKRASFFTRNKNGDKQPLFVHLLTPFCPLALFILQVVLKLLGRYNQGGPEMIANAIIGWMLAVGLLAIWHLICKSIEKRREAARLAEASDPAAREREAQRERDRAAEKQRVLEAQQRASSEAFDRRYREMVCPGAPLEASIEALPPSRRTLHLYFHELKSKVCKPFAR